MKFEHIINIYSTFIFKFNIFFGIIFNFFNSLFFFWKISNYADGYWFLFSNKKFLYESRFLI